ncbi:hypothetical protein ACFFJY_14435 [Fictibacillus aquaticus]|uniref:Uncharacterized protein n=1 Tax=Fictibacillus aquaticus TaxID=2021314 RepID=A0A235FEJ1_9BACL|nr:hypothetical protein [Fictibacillus aquaticus]OYD59413.1 hypothetical protein CGZ90_05860 [Fictibacillus aquaticus]
MKDTQTIQDELKSLSKYSLSDVQKQRVLTAIRDKRNSGRMKERSPLFMPILSSAAIMIVIFILVASEFPNLKYWSSTSGTETKKQIEFHTPDGERFELENGQKVIGVPNKVAFLDGMNFVAKDKRRGAKVMVYFWGDPEKLAGKGFKIKGTNRYGEELVLSEGTLGGAISDDDAHAPTRFAPFPTDGEWKLSFFVDDKLHGEFQFNVLPPFPQTKHYTLDTSPKEMATGKDFKLSIESTKKKKEIMVQLMNKEGKLIKEERFKRTDTFTDDDSSQVIYQYDGKIELPEKGTWMLIIDGERTQVFKN